MAVKVEVDFTILRCWECRHVRRSNEPGREFFDVCSICYRTDCPNKQIPDAVSICETCHSDVDYD